MAKVERDEEREEHMTMEIVVDAYGSEEQAMFVDIEWESNVLAVPLVQLDAPEVMQRRNRRSLTGATGSIRAMSLGRV